MYQDRNMEIIKIFLILNKSVFSLDLLIKTGKAANELGRKK